MAEAKRLTKAQREFFDVITKEILTGVIYVAMGDEDAEEYNKIIQETDFPELTEEIGQKYLEKISFTELKRVDRFFRSEECKQVQLVGAEVGEAVKDAVVEGLRTVLEARAATE